MTRETYDVAALHAARRAAIAAASSATRFGLILGTLGRQGATQGRGRLLLL